MPGLIWTQNTRQVDGLRPNLVVTPPGLVLASARGTPIVSASGGGEPVYQPGVHSLIVTDSFDAYANFAAAQALYPTGRSHEYCSLISPGRGGSGKAIRQSYGVGAGFDILFGTEGRLNNIGSWNGTLPQKAAPYTHLMFTAWFRFSPGGDPADRNINGIKGIMFFHPSNSRYEFAVNSLAQGSQSRIFKVFNPDNALSGLNVWKTPDGKAPLLSDYNDGQFHKVTIELSCGAIPTSQQGARVWIDTVKKYDDVGVDVVTGQGQWAGYVYNQPIADFRVFGNFVNGGDSNPFTLDWDDWTVWTD